MNRVISYAVVLLHRRVPEQFAQVLYEIPEGMDVLKGQLVVVPFRKQLLTGIVADFTSNKPSYVTRTIERVCEFIVPKTTMDLASWLSKKHSTTLRNVLHLIIPSDIWEAPVKKISTRRLSPASLKKTQPVISNEEKSEETYLHVANQCIDEKKNPTIILEKSRLDRVLLYKELSKKINADEQILFLVPETSYIELLELPFATYHGELKDRDKKNTWEAVAAGMVPICLGTRTAALLPFPNLKYIVLDYENSELYTEQRSPHYNVRDIAAYYEKNFGTKVIYISSAPTLATWNNLIEKQKATAIPWEEKNQTVHLVDMHDTWKKGLTGSLSDTALRLMATCMSRNEQVVVFVPRRGEAGALWCTHCGQVARCTKCNALLRPHKGEILACHKCGQNTETSINCGNCGNFSLKSVGIGTQKIESELNKIFELSVVMRVDKDAIEKENLGVIALNNKIQKADLIISTHILAKPFSLPRLKLVIFVSADSMLSGTSYDSEEKALQTILQISHLATDGDVVIQTLLPEHPVYKTIATNKLSYFYKKELFARKLLQLPPFNDLN